LTLVRTQPVETDEAVVSDETVVSFGEYVNNGEQVADKELASKLCFGAFLNLAPNHHFSACPFNDVFDEVEASVIPVFGIA
jgi:hypothetical protein